jgi:hypothetical protein
VFKQHGPVLLTKYYSDDQIKTTRWGDMEHLRGEERSIQVFGGETRERDNTWKIQA